MNRRRYLSASALAGATALAGCSSVGDRAVNVDDAKALESAEGLSFGRDVSVSWIDERFIESNSPDHPVVGTEVSFRAMVLSNLRSEEERLQTANDLQWANFEFAGDRILGTLFEPVEWVLDPAKELTESFYERYELMKLVGVTDADQRFFDRYGYAPFVWATAERDADFHPSGTIVDVTATIHHRGEEDDPLGPGDGTSAYVVIHDASPVAEYRDLTEDTAVGETASFAGLQFVEEPTLTTHLTNVDYEYTRQFPIPEGGSLVAQRGEVLESSFEVRNLVRENRATFATTDQAVLVGDTRSGDWEESGADTGTTTEAGGDGGADDAPSGDAPNVVAVVDVSGSMEDQDTRSGASRLTVAKQSARSLVNYVESGNRLGVASFSTSAETAVDLRPVDGARDRMLAAIDRLSPGGDTSIGGGLREALDMLEPAAGPKSIVLLSDGQQNEPPAVSSVLPDLESLGVTVYTIAMGSGADRALMERIAAATGGVAEFAPEPGEIRSLYQQFSVSAQGRSSLTSAESTLDPGEAVEETATVDGSCRDVQFSLSHEGGDVALDVERPDGSPVSSGGDASHRSGETNEVWTVDEPEAGEWRYRAAADATADASTDATVEVSADSPVDAELFVTDDLYEETGMVKLELKATNDRRRYTAGDVTFLARPAGADATASGDAATTDDDATASGGDGGGGDGSDGGDAAGDSSGGDASATREIALRDDGGGPDPVADDGLYTGYFHPPEAGDYEFTARLGGGEFADLEREFTESFSASETVEEPVRPYEPRSTSPLSRPIERYGAPAAIVGTMVAVLVGLLRTISEDG